MRGSVVRPKLRIDTRARPRLCHTASGQEQVEDFIGIADMRNLATGMARGERRTASPFWGGLDYWARWYVRFTQSECGCDQTPLEAMSI